MVYAPGHYRDITQPRQRGRAERISVMAAGVLAVILAAVAILSLTSHSGRNGGGCISFTYSTMIGGAGISECGARAKADCLSPPSTGGVNTDLQHEMYIACRKAGLPVG